MSELSFSLPFATLRNIQKWSKNCQIYDRSVFLQAELSFFSKKNGLIQQNSLSECPFPVNTKIFTPDIHLHSMIPQKLSLRRRINQIQYLKISWSVTLQVKMHPAHPVGLQISLPVISKHIKTVQSIN